MPDDLVRAYVGEESVQVCHLGGPVSGCIVPSVELVIDTLVRDGKKFLQRIDQHQYCLKGLEHGVLSSYAS